MTDATPTTRIGRKPVADLSAIVAAAWELIERHGYEGTTMSDIATKSGVSRRTLFNHVASKEALLFPGLDDYMRDFARVLSTRPVNEPVLAAMTFVIRELSAQTAAIESNFPCGPEVRAARLRPEATRFAHEQFAHWMNRAVLLWLGDTPETRITAGLVAALAAQVWTEMARIQSEDGVTIEAALERTMVSVSELLST